jgi:polyvinyl alcohol dehydrogenase (cytochrome)
VLVVACSSGPAARPAASPASGRAASTGAAGSQAGHATNWPTYHGNAARTGVALGLPPAGPLSLTWEAPLGAAVYGQPLVVGRTVVAATEADVVYALSRGTGKVLWRTKVGTPAPLSEQPCGDISPLGITSTPVYDGANGLVYVVAQDGRSRHVLDGIRVSDGKVVLSRDIPAPDHEAYYDQQRGALTIEDGRVYVVFGGHYGDCGPYRGSIVGVPASGRGAIVSYVVPTAKQGGIWGAGGPVIGPDGVIYVGAGNGAPTQGPFDGSDSVTALTPGLRRIGIFAPTDWRTLSADDLDLGSMSPALLADGQILQVGKSGVGYLLNAARLGGVGGQIASAPVCTAFGGAAVSGKTVYVPCYPGGLTAVDTAGDRVRVLWRGPSSAWGSPVLGGGAVWVADWTAGTLYELDPATGKVRHQISLGGPLPHFVSPTLSGGLVLVGTLSGVAAVSGA